MSTHAKNIISSLLEASSHFNANDVLVDAREDNQRLVFIDQLTELSQSEIPFKMIRSAELTFRETGINPMCHIQGLVEFDLGAKTVRSPLVLTSLEHRLDKVRKVYSLSTDAAVPFLNPFVLQHLNKRLDIEVPNELLDAPDLLEWESFLATHSIVLITDIQAIGNFHHHRFSVIRELEDLLETPTLNTSVLELLGEGAQLGAPLSLSSLQLFPSDTDHLRVFDSAKEGNLVIQGPPGTGKSQVLTNLVAKSVGGNGSVLVVSEKFAALDVIQKKLASFELDSLSAISTSHREVRLFLSDLKTCWDALESRATVSVPSLHLSKGYTDNLQMTLDLLGQEDLVGGISFASYQALLSEIDPEADYSSDVPELSLFLQEKSLIQKIYDLHLEKIIGHFRPVVIQQEAFSAFDKRIAGWLADLKKLRSVVEISTWGEISDTMLLAAKLQVFENELFSVYPSLLRPNSREQKRYLRLRKNYLKLVAKRTQTNHSHWKVLPSLTEVDALLSSLKKRGYFHRKKIRRRWDQLSHLPFESMEQSLHERTKEITLEEEISQITIKFCDLGIENPEIELPVIQQTLPHFTENHWEAYLAFSPKDREVLTQNHQLLHGLYRDLKGYFTFEESDDIHSFLTSFLNRLPDLISLHTHFNHWNSSLINVLREADTFSAYMSCVIGSHAIRFKERFPALSDFTPSDLHEKIERIIATEDEEAEQFAEQLKQHVLAQFQEAHQLLNTSSRTLSVEQKERKVRLRKGKSILVKEFNKTRQHPSLRELFQSEAREWIQLLKPIWLSNPSQLADCFPMEQGLFDVVIFDEASQIPLQNSLGALHRSGRAIIAGDEHQMGPSSYFVAKESDTTNLLHQASYHFPKVTLKHHYRSVHPDLIAFSNTHFYDNSLEVFPYFSKDPSCLHHHFIADGIFENRRNLSEAKAVAQHIEQRIKDEIHLGIVAFSEEHLSCIWEQLTIPTQDRLAELIKENTAFFKSVENVQGDECDELVISFAYGKNPDQEFHHRFGPMNTANGRKRLNVLLTRARKKIDFFCSVRANDFKLSDNESIDLVRQWVRFSENHQPDSQLNFPFRLTPEVKDHHLDFSSIYDTLTDAREIVTLHRVLTDRGWECNYS